MRDSMVTGPKYASELALVAGIPSSLVGAILKADIASGRVNRREGARGHQQYELAAGFDERLRRRIARARALLVHHGYAVTQLR